MAGEIRHLATLVGAMESSVDEIIERFSGALEPRIIRDIQLIDLVGQTLHALSSFTENAAGQAQSSWRIDGARAASGLTLAGLARRLTAGAVATAAPAEDASGDFEFFD
jgi:hypothetical protein